MSTVRGPPQPVGTRPAPQPTPYDQIRGIPTSTVNCRGTSRDANREGRHR